LGVSRDGAETSEFRTPRSNPGMNETPAVSVLLPFRDAGEHFEPALRSMARQSFRDFEVIAVDDGSSDESADRLEAWSRRDRRFRLVRQPPRGLVAALNTGLEHCRGELVARMDADDVSTRRRLELQVARLRAEPGLDVVSCLVRHFPRAEIAEGFRLYERWLNGLVTHEAILRERFIESPLAHPTVVLRRRLLEEVGGYRDRDWPEDYDLWLRLAERGARFAKVERRLYLWRDHPGRATRVDPRYAVERFLECKAHYLARGPLAGFGRILIWGAGQTGRKLSRHLLSRGVRIEAFLDVDPEKIGRTRKGLPIHDAEELPRILAGGEEAIVLVAVAARGARELIRERMTGFGLDEGRDYWGVA